MSGQLAVQKRIMEKPPDATVVRQPSEKISVFWDFIEEMLKENSILLRQGFWVVII